MKRDKLDRVFSLLVRERASWKCERCGKQYEPHSAGLHASHIFSRRARSARWWPQNAVAHCYHCHMWFGGNPVIGGDWAREYLGPDVVEAVYIRWLEPMRLTPPMLQDIHDNLQASYTRMLHERCVGKTGRIEFESPYRFTDRPLKKRAAKAKRTPKLRKKLRGGVVPYDGKGAHMS